MDSTGHAGEERGRTREHQARGRYNEGIDGAIQRTTGEIRTGSTGCRKGRGEKTRGSTEVMRRAFDVRRPDRQFKQKSRRAMMSTKSRKLESAFIAEIMDLQQEAGSRGRRAARVADEGRAGEGAGRKAKQSKGDVICRGGAVEGITRSDLLIRTDGLMPWLYALMLWLSVPWAWTWTCIDNRLIDHSCGLKSLREASARHGRLQSKEEY
ncbi:hypothetical protein DFH11DRAFT_1539281 [Phellopilus nigrolimitatus]|nr:hypothetical protein DFH11DRAFT_1539281 [Phellopilus nigrolimitatus]